jgi:hypothetical protein
MTLDRYASPWGWGLVEELRDGVPVGSTTDARGPGHSPAGADADGSGPTPAAERPV